MDVLMTTTTTTPLSNRIVNLSESATLQMAALARSLRQKGIDVITLSLGEPDFDTPDHIKEAAKRAIDENYSHYTPVAGYLELRQAVVQKLKRDNNLDFEQSQIVTSTGAKQSIANIVLSLVNPGEEVILPIPYWVSYAAQVELAEGVIVEVTTSIDNQFKMTAQELEAVITPQSKLLIFSSPCNPTGSVYTQEELQAIAEVIQRHEQLYVVSDEIYEHINFVRKHESIAQFESIKDRVVVVNGLSKGFAMTGWRLGYIAAPQDIANACTKMQGQFTSATCSITQRAAIEALTGSLEAPQQMKASFLKRRDLLLGLLADIKGLKNYVPEGAFYMFPDVSHYFGKTDGETLIENADDLCMYLLNKYHISLVTGSAFGNPNCVRISYAASEDILREAVSRIKTGLSALK